jgi:hypothetical protein
VLNADRGQYSRSRDTSIAARYGFVLVLRVECAGLLFVWTVLQNLSNNQLIMLRCISPKVAQMRSADRIELRLSLEAMRKTSTRDEYFTF